MKGLILALHWAKLGENWIKAGGKIQFGGLSKSSSPSLNQKQNWNWNWHSVSQTLAQWTFAYSLFSRDLATSFYIFGYLCILAVLQGDFNCSFPKSSKRQKSEATLFGACMPLNNLHIRKSPSLARQIDRHRMQFSGNFQIKVHCLLQTSFKFDWQPFRF